MRVYCSGKYKPKYGSKESAGLDLCNNNEPEITKVYSGGVLYDEVESKELKVLPGAVVEVKTKTHVQLPKNTVGIVAVRSGLGFKGLDLINSVGVIDEDYRGEIGLKFINRGDQTITISEGERVAQIIQVKINKGFQFVKSLHDLTETERGIGGFGSTGKF